MTIETKIKRKVTKQEFTDAMKTLEAVQAMDNSDIRALFKECNNSYGFILYTDEILNEGKNCFITCCKPQVLLSLAEKLLEEELPDMLEKRTIQEIRSSGAEKTMAAFLRAMKKAIGKDL